jgi:hypothetical protein
MSTPSSVADRSWALIIVLGLLGPVFFLLILIHRRARRGFFAPFARWLVSKWEAVNDGYRRWLP